MEEKKNKGLIGYVIIAILLIFVAGAVFLIPSIADTLKSKKEAELMSNLENIYTSAIIVDEIEGGLHEDSGDAGKYDKLSELSGFRVYNAAEKKKYSVMKDYNSGEIIVRHGKDLQYPKLAEDEDDFADNGDLESTKDEDLFNYDESEGKVVITGFSETGVGLLESDSVIQIPSSYKGRDVVEIDEKAFYNRNIMGTVVIPENIQQIGNNAFSNNGVKGISNNIDKKPYAGSWKVDEKSWVKSN